MGDDSSLLLQNGLLTYLNVTVTIFSLDFSLYFTECASTLVPQMLQSEMG